MELFVLESEEYFGLNNGITVYQNSDREPEESPTGVTIGGNTSTDFFNKLKFSSISSERKPIFHRCQWICHVIYSPPLRLSNWHICRHRDYL